MGHKNNLLSIALNKRKMILLTLVVVIVITGVWFYLNYRFVHGHNLQEKAGEAVGETDLEQEQTLMEDHYLDDVQSLMYIKPDSARLLANARLDILEEEGDLDKIIPYMNVIGISYMYQGQYNNALKMFFQSLKLTIGDDHLSDQAHAFNNIGAVLLMTKKYKDALDYFFKSRDITQELGDTINESTSLNNIGRLYLEIDDMSNAIIYLNKAGENFSSHNHKVGISSVSNNKALYFLKKEMADSAQLYFRKAIDMGKKSENNRGLSIFYFEKGNFFLEIQDYDAAISYYQKSDSLSEMLTCNLRSCFAHLGIARTYLEKGVTATANAYVKKAKEINEELNCQELQYLINEVLSDIYTEQNNYYKAFTYYKLAQEQKEQIYDQTEIYQVYNVEIDQLTRKMELKELEMERQDLLLGKRKNTMYLIVVASLSMLIILSMLYYFYINKVKQLQKEKLHENKIRHSYEKNRAVMEAEINERKRIGSDLHDGIGALLSLTKLNLTKAIRNKNLEQVKKENLLMTSVNNMDEIIDEVKHISNNMTPIVLTEKGFKEAVKELVGKISHFTVDLNINGLNDSLDPHIEHALYRTVQEALNNMTKHASCTKANIQILKNKNEINLMIEDNGKGFDVNRLHGEKCLGLKNVSSRIESLQGQFYIDSIEGRGTILNISIPV